MFAGILYIFLSMAAAAPQKCCYTNPGYAGICVVQPQKGETCSSVLNYLNSAGTTGKTYCNSTTIRGGWKQVRCR